MKNLSFLILICLLWLAIPSGKAQVSFGISGKVNEYKAPLVIKRDLFSKTLSNSFNPGFGLFVEYQFKPEFSLKTELNYQEQRHNYLLSGGDNTIYTSVLEYLRLPIMAKFKMPFNNWFLVGEIGSTVGYAVQLKSGETDRDFNLTQYQLLDFEQQDVKRFDAGIMLGAGVEKVIANKFRTALFFNYHHGVIDIMEDDQSTFFNRGYSVDMAFSIPFSIFQSSEKPAGTTPSH